MSSRILIVLLIAVSLLSVIGCIYFISPVQDNPDYSNTQTEFSSQPNSVSTSKCVNASILPYLICGYKGDS